MSSSSTKSDARLPDFIIGGAMKSATSTLHYILAHHEEIFIPDGEIHFFSVDDITEHPALFQRYGSEWAFQDYEGDFGTYLSWYEQFFVEAREHQTIGEDSTVYLPSVKAPERIAELIPDVKLIFLLRDPVVRAYSHYWHRLREGRATRNFRNTLQYGDDVAVTRGVYRKQLERYFALFPREQITVLIFEDFLRNMQAHIDALCDTLGLSQGVDLTGMDTTQRNATYIPRWPSLLAYQNRLFRGRNARHYQHHLPDTSTDDSTLWGKVLDSLNHRLRYLNLTDRTKPPMDSSCKSFLQRLYAKENRGLSDLIGVDVSQYWPYMDE